MKKILFILLAIFMLSISVPTIACRQQKQKEVLIEKKQVQDENGCWIVTTYIEPDGNVIGDIWVPC